jgi:hypothetical protein
MCPHSSPTGGVWLTCAQWQGGVIRFIKPLPTPSRWEGIAQASSSLSSKPPVR